VCEGQSLELTTDYASLAQYLWTGPNGFTSTEANPVVAHVTTSATGVYSVLITGQNCVSEREVEVDIISSPNAQINTIETSVCEGDIVFLGANDIPGATWSWTGPNEFAVTSRNYQLNNANPSHAGLYILSACRGGCTGTPDSVSIVVFQKPIITLVGDSVQTPGAASVIYVTGESDMTYYWNFFGDAELMDTRVFTGGADSLIVFWQDREGMLRIEVIEEDSNGCRSSEAVLPIHVTNAVGLVDRTWNPGILVYPNPAHETLTIKTTANKLHQAEIRDTSGRSVHQFSFNSDTFHLGLSDFNAGIYILRIDGSTRIISITK